MDTLSNRLAALPPEHREALEWFWARQGDLIPWPETLNGLFLVNRPKGIHKPKGWTHTLSVRQALKGPYADQPPMGSINDGWTYRYLQEGADPKARDKHPTNRGLMACKADDVPVAVLIQEQAKPKVRYRVWGLAKVAAWDAGYFGLIGYSKSGELTPNLPYYSPHTDYSDLAEFGPPLDFEDFRRRIEQQIYVRQGGGAFRRAALRNSNGRCAISGCDVAPVLEAAHIVPYLGTHTNAADNALLLRADLHTLFDQQLLSINPDTLKVELDESLRDSVYAELSGQSISISKASSPETLRQRLLERALVFEGKKTMPASA